MNYLRLILIFSLFVTITACNSGKTEIEKEQIELSEELKDKFSDKTSLIYGTDTLLAGAAVLDYYKGKDFVPLWIRKDSLTSAGIEMYNLVEKSRDYVLLP